MKKRTIPAYGKINLTLDVIRKRPDGYHDVEMVMQSIELHDLVTIEETTHQGIWIACTHPLVPCDQRNLAYLAAELLANQYGIRRGLKITIAKNLPVAAGLAGGSTNAAAVLTGLNELWELGLSQEELMRLGGKLGADVPFCIMGGTALATGIGTDLTPMNPAPQMELVLVTPDLSVSTKEVYTRYTPELVQRKPDLPRMQKALEDGNVAGIKAALANVLEPVTLHYYPQVAKAKGMMENLGIDPVVMSGSGPTLFTIADTREVGGQYAEWLMECGIGQVNHTRTRR